MAARSSMLSVYTSLTFLAVYVLIFMSSVSTYTQMPASAFKQSAQHA